MASVNAVLHVSCTADRPSVSRKFERLKGSLFGSLKSVKGDFQHQLKLQVDRSTAIVKETGSKVVEVCVDFVIELINQPLPPLQENFAPTDELVEPLSIVSINGAIPDSFPEGIYLRNGSNPLFGGFKSTNSIFGKSSSVWVEGEGMLHALYLNKDVDGSWKLLYNKKFVESATYKLEKQKNRPLFLPATEGDSLAVLSASMINLLRFGKINKDISNTNVFEHSGKIYAVSESHMPQEIDLHSLQTLGEWNVDGMWNRPFCSHPKKIPGSGELVIIGVDGAEPFVVLGVISADGKKLLHKVDLQYKRSVISHEVGITQRYNVLLDFPLVIDLGRAVRGGPLIKYVKSEYARIGVMPHYGNADSVKWFDVETCMMFHIINTFEDGDDVVVWGCRARASIIPGPDLGVNKLEWFSKGLKHVNLVKGEGDDDGSSQDGLFFTRCYEWRLNMITGEVKEKYLSGTEFSMDFPMINYNFTGLKNSYGYTQVVDSVASSAAGMPKYGGLAKLHLGEPKMSQQGAKGSNGLIEVEYHMFEENTFCSGAAFVPGEGRTEEDDGWIITYVHNEATNESKVLIVDTRDFAADPVATIALPYRVPYGFHGSFIKLPPVSLH